VQAIGILANKMQPQYNAAGATYGIAIGIWKGSADQGGQQLEIEHAKELLKSMQSMLDLKEEGNRLVTGDAWHAQCLLVRVDSRVPLGITPVCAQTIVHETLETLCNWWRHRCHVGSGSLVTPELGLRP